METLSDVFYKWRHARYPVVGKVHNRNADDLAVPCVISPEHSWKRLSNFRCLWSAGCNVKHVRISIITDFWKVNHCYPPLVAPTTD